MKKAKPKTAEAPKHDQNLRVDFDTQFNKLGTVCRFLARNDVRYLMTHLALTHEFALSFDADNGRAARELCPDLFPERKNNKGYSGDTVYFRYISQAQKDAREFAAGLSN